MFVAFDDETFTAAEAVRRRSPDVFWSELSDDHRALAVRLARSAAAGELVVFFGAGVSTGAGLPDWKGLIDRLAKEVGLGPEFGDPHDRLLDWAAVIEARFERRARAADGVPSDLRLAIARLFTPEPPRSTLTHTLLASLPVREFATMNYDALFEQAAEAAARPVAVLPWQTTKGFDRWLLKMHGSVDHPEEIVLTRADYLRYSETRGALQGLVQALLITRHMLFVGFGLADDNFYRIADDVRRAVRHEGYDGGPFGTALALRADSLTSALWSQDLDIVPLTTHGQLDVFLDFMVAEATTLTRYLLDDRFADVLTAQEEKLRDALRTFQAAVVEADVDLAAWPAIGALLEAVGGYSSG